MVEDLLFNYHDVSSTVKKHIVQKTSHEKQGKSIFAMKLANCLGSFWLSQSSNSSSQLANETDRVWEGIFFEV
jgi:hypothetical protein